VNRLDAQRWHWHQKASEALAETLHAGKSAAAMAPAAASDLRNGAKPEVVPGGGDPGKALRFSASERRVVTDSIEPPVCAQEDRLSRFMQEHPRTTYADIKYSAAVHTPDFQDWRKGKLKPDSVMSKRIEDVLSGATSLKKKPRKRRSD
jgi:hypothetical protein